MDRDAIDIKLGRADMSRWYRINTDDSGIHRDVRPPGAGHWSDTLDWQALEWVAFVRRDGGGELRFGLAGADEPEAIPAGAGGFEACCQALAERGWLDDAMLARTLDATVADE